MPQQIGLELDALHKGDSHVTRASFQRRHARIIAEALLKEKPLPTWDANKHAQWLQMCNAIGNAVLVNMLNFDRAKWDKACGITD